MERSAPTLIKNFVRLNLMFKFNQTASSEANFSDYCLNFVRYKYNRKIPFAWRNSRLVPAWVYIIDSESLRDFVVKIVDEFSKTEIFLIFTHSLKIYFSINNWKILNDIFMHEYCKIYTSQTWWFFTFTNIVSDKMKSRNDKFPHIVDFDIFEKLSQFISFCCYCTVRLLKTWEN